jgi:HK97 family phage portal protein
MFDWLRAKLGNIASKRVRGLSLVAGYLANVLWLMESTWRSLIKQGYGGNSIAYSAIRLLSQSVPEARLRAYTGEDDDREPLPSDHELMRLIRRPNELMTEFEFWELSTIQLAAVGRSVWFKERANGGSPIALWPLRPDRVAPVYTNTPGNPLRGWAYGDPTTGTPQFIPAADCIVFNFPDPDGESGGIVEGLGPLSASRADLSADNLATQHVGALLANYAQPGIALKIPDGIPDQATADLIKAKFRQEFGGNRIGTPAILDAGADIVMLGFNLQQLEFSGLRSDTESRICAAIGVPSILVGANSGLRSSTFSNFESARLFFTETTLAFTGAATRTR